MTRTCSNCYWIYPYRPACCLCDDSPKSDELVTGEDTCDQFMSYGDVAFELMVYEEKRLKGK